MKSLLFGKYKYPFKFRWVRIMAQSGAKSSGKKWRENVFHEQIFLKIKKFSVAEHKDSCVSSGKCFFGEGSFGCASQIYENLYNFVSVISVWDDYYKLKYFRSCCHWQFPSSISSFLLRLRLRLRIFLIWNFNFTASCRCFALNYNPLY